MKRILCIFMLTAALLLAGCGRSSPPEETTGQTTSAKAASAAESTQYIYLSSDPVAVKAYGEGAARAAVAVSPGGMLGMRLWVNAPFTAFSYNVPTWTETGCAVTLSLRRWAGDWESTAASEPIASRRFAELADCADQTLEFPEQPPGEYLFTLSDPLGSAGTWIVSGSASGGYYYRDGLEAKGDLCLSLQLTSTPENPFSEVKSVYDYSVKVVTPEEYVLPDDAAVFTRDAMSDTWVCTDGLGRTLPGNAEAGDPRGDRFVGMFYWSWHNTPGGAAFNNTEFIKEHPELKNDYESPLWPLGVNHYWDEPIFDYYLTTDEWVLRKQAEMLAAAGVDVIFFDNTNGVMTWRESYTKIFKVFAQALEDGVKVPKISFILPFGDAQSSAAQLRELYLDIFRPGKYRELWFYWEGKPLIMSMWRNMKKNSEPDSEIRDFFTFRTPQPVYAPEYTAENSWGWLSVYPQTEYRSGARPDVLEQMTVGVAQNWTLENGLSAMNAEGTVFDRTYTSKGYDTRENAKLYGANFAEQWEYALEKDPEFVFVTGWNEWTAGRYSEWQGTVNAFPDEFNDIASRDIEPTKGDLKDHYYYQLAAYIRRFKGVRALPEASEAKTIDIFSSGDQWSGVLPEYIGYAGNTLARDAVGRGGVRYTDSTGRNDIVSARVAQDEKYLYFLCETASALTPSSDPGWMRLYIDTGAGEGWEGYDYIINKRNPSGTTAYVERFTEGWESEMCGEADISVSGSRLQLRVPRGALGIGAGGFSLNFKWSDNIQTDGDIMDFYVSGDTAPLGRFMFRYESR